MVIGSSLGELTLNINSFFGCFGLELNMKSWEENPRVGSREVAGKWP